MSYWTYLEIDTGTQAVDVVEIGNYTANVGVMWCDALGGKLLREFDGAPCSEAAGPLAEGVKRMEANPDHFRAMNPPNGWGDYEGALRYLRDIAEACVEHPRCRIRISA
ncbi:hypothetical protein [Streptomyces sp.]|uniref:hypothetical protein n=1 Tax=Streptomyces sp. TaxID=1931 RepID=UPI002F94FD38